MTGSRQITWNRCTCTCACMDRDQEVWSGGHVTSNTWPLRKTLFQSSCRGPAQSFIRSLALSAEAFTTMHQEWTSPYITASSWLHLGHLVPSLEEGWERSEIYVPHGHQSLGLWLPRSFWSHWPPYVWMLTTGNLTLFTLQDHLQAVLLWWWCFHSRHIT